MIAFARFGSASKRGSRYPLRGLILFEPPVRARRLGCRRVTRALVHAHAHADLRGRAVPLLAQGVLSFASKQEMLAALSASTPTSR